MKRRKYRQKKRHANPYFRTTERNRISRSLVLFVLTIMGFIGMLSVFVYAPFVRMGVGEVVGASDDLNSAISQQASYELQRRSWFILPKNHKWFFSEESLSKVLLDNNPLNVADVSIYDGSVNIRLSEKISIFYLVKDDVMFSVDRYGTVLSVVDDLDRARIEIEYDAGRAAPLINDRRSASIGEGETVLSPQWLEDIVKLFDQIQSRTMLTPMSANLSDEDGRIDVETDAGVTLYFTLNRPIESQVDKLEALIDRKLVQITELSYIDLRFTNRLFYH